MDDYVRLRIQEPANNPPSYETVPARKDGDALYELKNSPGMALGAAAGDLVRIADDDGAFEVVRRSGNVAVQCFVAKLSSSARARAASVLETELESLGGWLDGGSARVMIYTVPVAAGLDAISERFEAVAQAYRGFVWMYGNVYDVDGHTPLNWWLVTDSGD